MKGTCGLDKYFFAELKNLFEGAKNERLAINGFYDGQSEWVIRFSPTTVGTWKYTLSSPHINLAESIGENQCIPNDNHQYHGGLKIHPENLHHFQYEDGTPLSALW